MTTLKTMEKQPISNTYMPNRPLTFETLHANVRKIATEVATIHAPDVDKNARFPAETIAALKAAGALSAPIPKSLGGAGCNMKELALLCSTLSGACGSSGMVLAMHYIQVGCIARHSGSSQLFESYQREIVDKQLLLASITSENGTFGDTRSSICAIERKAGRFVLNKQATTGSYCQYADGILVTCRKNTEAAKSDQVLVLVRKEDAVLTQTSSWDTMGMRGTCSPGFDLESSGLVDQILPVDYADISAETMVPYSHILWSALWWGIAADAMAKAASYVRSVARKNPGTIPPAANKLAEVSVHLQSMRHNWLALANDFDDIAARHYNKELRDMGWGLKMNNLKVSTSDTAPQIVHRALQIIGILAYKNDSPYSLNRHYRDVLSASLMISNERVLGKSASLLMVFKDE
jgi:acyl-CoA dehydrogenase